MTDTTPTADAVLRERFEWWWDRDAQAKSGHAHSERCGDKYATTHMSAEWGAFQAGHAFALAAPAPQPDALDARTVRAAYWEGYGHGAADREAGYNPGDTTNEEDYPCWMSSDARALATAPQRKDDAGVGVSTLRAVLTRWGLKAMPSAEDGEPYDLGDYELSCILQEIAPAAQGDAEPVYQVLAGDWQEVDRAFYEASPAQHRRILYAAAPRPASDDTRDAGLDWLERECADLRCVPVPTAGGDDADVEWQVITHHMAKPHERVIGSGNTPRAAIDAAMSRQPTAATQTDHLLTLSANNWSAVQLERGWEVRERDGAVIGTGTTQAAAIADAVARRDVGGAR